MNKKKSKWLTTDRFILFMICVVFALGCYLVARSRAMERMNDDAVEAESHSCADATGGVNPDIDDELFTSSVDTKHGEMICLKPDLNRLQMDLMCGGIPSAKNDSIILAFAGAFTGTEFDKGHSNVAGDHVSGGKRYKGYRCKRNTGAFTWSAKSGPRFYYKDYSSGFDRAAREGGMGFAQEMMIHSGKAVRTTRPAGNKNVFRALCLDADGRVAVYESRRVITFGNFIDALLSRGVKEALYVDMGAGWDYCFYRNNHADVLPKYLHSKSLPYSSNFIVIKTK